MHFTQATSAILAALAFSSTVFAAVLSTPDDFCNYKLGCTWSNPPDWAGVLQCSCNTAAPDAASVLLLEAYTDWNYQGYVYEGYSVAGKCNNLPGFFNRNTESIDIKSENTPGCWLYTVPDCPAGAEYAVVDKNNIAELEGIYDKGIQSWICDPLTS